MRLGTMTAIVVLLVSVTGGSEGSNFSQLETALSSSQSSRADRQHKHRHGYSNPRHGARRRRLDTSAAAAPLQLPPDLQESDERVELEHGRRRYAEPSGDYSVCCPAVEERTSPKAGRRRDGSLARLYASGEFQQVFFERSCGTQAADQPPLRLPRRLRYRCVQEYSYSYAVLDISGSKVLDLIRIRSGCRCEVKHRSSRRKKKRRRDRKKRAEIRRKRLRQRGGQSQTNSRNAS